MKTSTNFNFERDIPARNGGESLSKLKFVEVFMHLDKLQF